MVYPLSSYRKSLLSLSQRTNYKGGEKNDMYKVFHYGVNVVEI